MAFHFYDIAEIYSNADGTIQFIELVTTTNGQNLFNGHTLEVTSGDSTNTFVFVGNLPSSATANTSVLIATQGFADLGIVTPDYIVPDDFLFTAGGTLDFGDGSDVVVYSALPDDGVLSVNDAGATGANSPGNFAGDTGTIPGNPILGDSGADSLNGTAFADYMLGKAGIDTLNGQSGDDILLGGGSADTLDGGAGDDTLKGGGGDDIIAGGDRDDLLVGSKGSDTLDGGEGNDTYQIVTKDAGTIDAFNDSGSTGTDTIDATRVTVLQFADTFDDSNGIELITGNITVGTTLAGVTGPVIWDFSSLTLTDITLLQGTTGADQITGSGGDDKINGLGGDDTLSGGVGTDTLKGGGGADLLNGGTGDDVLRGGGGIDDLHGDAGSDSLGGGAGADSFFFETIGTGNVDTITDFSPGEDEMVLAFVTFGVVGVAVDATEFVANASGTPQDGNDYLVYNTSTGALFFDADGNGSGMDAVQVATLTGAPTIDAGDFLVFGVV